MAELLPLPSHLFDREPPRKRCDPASKASRLQSHFDISIPHSLGADLHVRRERKKRARLRAAPVGLVNRHISTRDKDFPENSRVTCKATVEVYGRDSVITREVQGLQSNHDGGGIRGVITELSRQAVKRMKFTFRNMDNPRVMLTLTYPREFPMDGQTVKRHQRAFFEAIRRKFNIPHAWFLEFQARGAPHFHIFLWDWISPGWVSETWYRIVGSGDPLHLKAGTRVEWLRKPSAASAYASKYAAKMEQKQVPEGYTDVGRFWGISRKMRPRPRVTLNQDTGPDLFQAIRTLRKLYNARRRKWGLPPIRDGGRYTLTLWGCGADSETNQPGVKP